jgi:hypothetical protein
MAKNNPPTACAPSGIFRRLRSDDRNLQPQGISRGGWGQVDDVQMGCPAIRIFLGNDMVPWVQIRGILVNSPEVAHWDILSGYVHLKRSERPRLKGSYGFLLAILVVPWRAKRVSGSCGQKGGQRLQPCAHAQITITGCAAAVWKYVEPKCIQMHAASNCTGKGPWKLSWSNSHGIKQQWSSRPQSWDSMDFEEYPSTNRTTSTTSSWLPTQRWQTLQWWTFPASAMGEGCATPPRISVGNRNQVEHDWTMM